MTSSRAAASRMASCRFSLSSASTARCFIIWPEMTTGQLWKTINDPRSAVKQTLRMRCRMIHSRSPGHDDKAPERIGRRDEFQLKDQGRDVVSESGPVRPTSAKALHESTTGR